MNDSESSPSKAATGWDEYWRGTGEIGAYSMGGVSHPAILNFWDDFFQAVKMDYPAPKMIDLASGNGAVVERAIAALGDDYGNFTCLDASESAVTNIQSRFPGVNGVVADACSVPLESDGFDIVTSQFGIEYAGLAAIDEAARLLAPAGRLALLLHIKAGSIYQECSESLDAILRLRESRFIPCAIELFRAGFEACSGSDRAPYEAAAMKLAPAIQALESIMEQYGEHVAGDTLGRLYSDVDRIHRNMPRYEPTEVLGWLGRMEGELEAYAARMSSMCASAIDQESFERLSAGLRDRGCTTLRAEPLTAAEQDVPLAWVLIATKGSLQAQQQKDAAGQENSADSVQRGKEKLQIWIKQQVDGAIKELTRSHAFGKFPGRGKTRLGSSLPDPDRQGA